MGNKKGFTLIELLVVITLLAIIVTIGITTASQLLKNARDTQRKADLLKIAKALQQYYADQGFYPSNGISGSDPEIEMRLDATSMLSNRSGNPELPAISKIYLNPFPRDIYQDTDRGIHYCYHANISPSDTDTAADPICLNTNESNKCRYFRLFAHLETGGDSTYSCTDAPGSVHPTKYNYYIDSTM
jgi:prepilin-type N-terminal cleavage/methylation domain-containing protein